jgi:hypothetical protein
MSAERTIVDYAPHPKIPWHKHPGLMRWTLRLLILLPLLWLAIQAGIGLHRTILLHRCAAYLSKPDSLIVYSPTPNTTSLAAFPECWADASHQLGLRSNGGGPIFLHGRTSPAGKYRLIFVEVLQPLSGDRFEDITLQAIILPTESFTSAPTVIGSSSMKFPVSGGPLQIYAGQPDARDPSHFTITMKTGAKMSLLDGWLRDDDSVVIEERK